MSNSTVTPPELGTLDITIEGEIGTLTLNRPDSFNAMSPEMIEELGIALPWLADQAPLRALIITGAGPAFSSGGDINFFKEGVSDPDIDVVAAVRVGAEKLHQSIIDLHRIEYPVIAAINGPAAGAGFSLALACDFRICSESAFLACAYGRIGASPDGGLTYFLPRVVGPSRALELLLNDPNLTPEDALADRLVSEVVAPDELMERAREKAEKLARSAPYYVKTVKRLVHSSLDRTIADHLQYERHGIAESMATEDLAEAVTAFLAGEKAEFKGR
jgi:2-(1,2-epoxy-1,2-dihydrophenyl)acetyl-CoA isomerase